MNTGQVDRTYLWEATDETGRTYTQDVCSYEALQHHKLQRFRLLMLISQNGSARSYPVITLHLEEGERVIYRRRVDLPTGGPSRTVILIGAQRLVRGRNVQRLAWVDERTGEVHMTGAFKEGHAWFYSPNMRSTEQP